MDGNQEFIDLAQIRREVDGSNRLNTSSKKGPAETQRLERARGQAIGKGVRRLGPARTENVALEWRR